MTGPGANAPPQRFPGAFPRVTDHLVRPEVTREEVIRGHKVVALPADKDHGDPHFRLDYVLGAHVAPGFVASTDLLTRFTEGSNFASDTCVRREGTDPATGDRYLEEVVFEVVNEQRLTGKARVSSKAAEMAARGVRRVFGIFPKTGAVGEWHGEWRPVPDGITDVCFARPLPVRAILHAAHADNAVATALVEKGNPVIQRVRADERREGRREAQQEAILHVLESRGVELSDGLRAQIRAVSDPWVLDQLLVRAAIEVDPAGIFPARG